MSNTEKETKKEAERETAEEIEEEAELEAEAAESAEKEIRVIVKEQDAGTRLDKFLAQKTGASRQMAANMIKEGLVQVNGKMPQKSHSCTPGEVVEASLPQPKEIEAKPQEIPLDIVYEDEDLLVVNKEKGMVVHPAPGNPDGTLVNALLHHCRGHLSGINGELRPGIVHRIDKDTSGLLVVAKNNKAHESLAVQVASHEFKREYECVAHGVFQNALGTIDAPIGRSQKDRKKMAVTAKNSKPAVTHYMVLRQFKSFAHLRCQLETGRTHQIRVHLAYIGHPVAGDEVYGTKNTPKLNGQCLHAKSIAFRHPKTGEYMEFDSELPQYFKDFLEKLEKEEPA